MKHTQKIGIIILLIVAMVLPAMACAIPVPCILGSSGCPEHNVIDNLQPVDVDVSVNPVNNFNPAITILPATVIVKPNIDVDQSQKQSQNQGQIQVQGQDQKQSQSQKNEQIVNVPLPIGADGGLLISSSNNPPVVKQLDVGNSQTFSRLVYPGEVIPFEIKGGDTISMLSASDVGFYTIGTFHDDVIRINSLESIPTYDPVYHKFNFGTVSPVDKIDYWTTKATLTSGRDATYIVVDNRAPGNTYTHVEVLIQDGQLPKLQSVPPVHPALSPDVYQTDENGNAVTS